MKTLMIKDLSASVELDSKAMASVAGGTLGRVRRLPYWGAPSLSVSLTDIDTKSVIASQDLAQVMNVDTATGINTAFADHLQSNVATSQFGANNISIR
ncbi:hypothetical protein ACFL3A_07985 [Pseudomonadota bacterium]